MLGVLTLIASAIGAYYANGLRAALTGSELAQVWQYVGIGVVMLFVGAIAGGAVSVLSPGQELLAVLLFMLLGSASLAFGLKLQLDKVK
ncbi:MAG: hypothetical protein D6733_01525 [Methanobacteriota archaeon]|nr:MAG: hypothetical protein D6733_01525 [Euryarchaeota archaeon]